MTDLYTAMEDTIIDALAQWPDDKTIDDIELIDAELLTLMKEDEEDLAYYGEPLSSPWKQGRSLRGGLALTEAAVHGGGAEAMAAVEGWRFKANRATIIRYVTPEKFKAMVERNPVTFHG